MRAKQHLIVIALLFGCVSIGTAEDQPQWGEKHSRNMVSTETGLIGSFDLESKKNIKWIAPLGSESWSTPIAANGKVLIGTNNNQPRDPRHKGDRGVLFCLNENDGSLSWQLVVPKLGPDPYLDWPNAGIPSTATVDGDRVYIITNRNEVVCLDLQGLHNGNDGPYLDEGQHMGLGLDDVYEPTKMDADILWIFDIPNQAGTYPHDSAHCSVLVDGDFLYINTSNGVDNTHKKIRKPDAPSLIVLNKKDGSWVARDDERIGPRIFHSTWSSPAMGVVDGQKTVFFCGGDGVVYAFKALAEMPADGTVKALERIWKYDCDPTAPKENVSEYMRNRDEGPTNIKGLPVFYNNRIYVAAGGDIWWGKTESWLHCIDATKQGDVTESGPLWKYRLGKHSCATPAIANGLLFISDCDGMLYCLDAETGESKWTHDLGDETWASPFVADGKVYIGTKLRRFYIFAAKDAKEILFETRLDSPVGATVTVANGVVYVASLKNLYALEKK
ncbi:MAG: PQQ-binding-like beta-propeller repeat protein [Candidatus Hinthialibacter antarcticus]|nr:PQQ-binding-like beta-propeller repeat protein [Candidatus Hinthialibacter antarcticus]